MAHSLAFSVAWLPLASGEGVLYNSRCTAMSWAPAAAFTMSGFFFLHTGSMVVAFDGLSSGKPRAAWAVAAVHLAASLLTIVNSGAGACMAVTVLGGSVMGLAAFALRRQMTRPASYAPIADTNDGQ